jgi:hypothetical protein
VIRKYVSLSRFNQGLLRSQTHLEVVQGTVELHHPMRIVAAALVVRGIEARVTFGCELS